jgi:hypothetical protein
MAVATATDAFHSMRAMAQKGSIMIRACCPECRLRCSPAAAMYLDTCSSCGGPLQPVSSLRDLVGFRLVEQDALPPSATGAAAVAISVSYPGAPGATVTSRRRSADQATDR